MKIENALTIGEPLLPDEGLSVIVYYDHPLIGTFKIQSATVLFWALDVSEPIIRFAFVELTDDEAKNVGSYFVPSMNRSPLYEHHPILSGRRVVVGVGKNWVLTELGVIEHPESRLFDQIERLFPVGD